MPKALMLVIIVLCCGYRGSAQLCNGSLGDPVINITFGNSSAPLAPGITTMIFKGADCPNDGQYTITHSTAACYNNTWHTTATDHTGDRNGQFMLINASVTPDDFYVDTVRGLCGNTSFEFAAWVANMLETGACGTDAQQPNLTFQIELPDKTVIAQYNTGKIAATPYLSWTQFGTFFKTPANVGNLVLRIRNNAPGGCGNDLALDDITFRPCGPMVSSSVRGSAQTSFKLCDGDPQHFTMDVSSSAGFNTSIIQWQLSIDTGKTWTDITGARSASFVRAATEPGYYEYRVVTAEANNFSSLQCRVASNILSIQIDAVPKINGPHSVTACLGNSLQLTVTKDTAYTYRWSGPNGYTSSAYYMQIPSIRYIDSGFYKIVVNTSAGCSGADSVDVHVDPNVTATVSGNVTICEGQSTLLTASGGAFYQWTPATGLSATQIANPIASPADTTFYKVAVSNADGCTDTGRVMVGVFKNPKVSAGPDKEIFEGESATLEGMVTGQASGFYWLPNNYMNNSGSLTPAVNPTDTTTYTLYALPGLNCPAVSDAAFVRVYKKLTVPNVFSPNGDGINDSWVIKGIDSYPNAVIRVYNRTGGLVFQTRSNGQQWDGLWNGKPVPVDTYYYTIALNIRGQVLSGWVLVIR